MIIALLLATMLRCEPATITDWRQALVYGDLIGYMDYPVVVSGTVKIRHTRWQVFRKRLTVFVYEFPDVPGARAGSAWHGCGMYDYADYWP